MLGALGKAFGGAGKAIGKGVKTGAKKGLMGMKDRMSQPQSGGINTGPSEGLMQRSALSNMMMAGATAGQPDTQRNQVSGPGFGINPNLTQMILQKVYGSQQPPMPTNPGTGQNMSYAAQDGMVNNPNVGVMGPNPAGMDVGPTMPMMNRRMHGMF